jgi:hypothetical protein
VERTKKLSMEGWSDSFFWEEARKFHTEKVTPERLD